MDTPHHYEFILFMSPSEHAKIPNHAGKQILVNQPVASHFNDYANQGTN